MCFVMEISYQNLIVLEVSLGNATQPLSLSLVCVCRLVDMERGVSGATRRCGEGGVGKAWRTHLCV